MHVLERGAGGELDGSVEPENLLDEAGSRHEPMAVAQLQPRPHGDQVGKRPNPPTTSSVQVERASPGVSSPAS